MLRLRLHAPGICLWARSSLDKHVRVLRAWTGRAASGALLTGTTLQCRASALWALLRVMPLGLFRARTGGFPCMRCTLRVETAPTVPLLVQM